MHVLLKTVCFNLVGFYMIHFLIFKITVQCRLCRLWRWDTDPAGHRLWRIYIVHAAEVSWSIHWRAGSLLSPSSGAFPEESRGRQCQWQPLQHVTVCDGAKRDINDILVEGDGIYRDVCSKQTEETRNAHGLLLVNDIPPVLQAHGKMFAILRKGAISGELFLDNGKGW